MFKKSLLLMLLMTLLAPWAANAQTVTIGTSTTTSQNWAPIENYYNYSFVEMLFLPSEIAEGSPLVNTIINLGFYTTTGNNGWDYDITVYMKNVDETELGTTFLEVSNDDVYFTGNVGPVEANSWMTFDLDKVFTYDPTKSLLIAVNKTAGHKDGSSQQYPGSSYKWNYTATTGNTILMQHNDSSGAYAPATTLPLPSTSTSYPKTNRPNIQLVFGTPATCVKPTALTKGTITAHTAELSWTSEASAFQICVNDDEENLIDVTTTSYTLENLTGETAYTVKVRTKCSATEVSAWSNTVSFTTAIACPKPTGLAAALTPGNGSIANLSWTETGDASDWVLQYAENNEFTSPQEVTNGFLVEGVNISIDIMGLTAETTYYARVKAACGGIDGESQWSNVISFTPTDAYAITVNDKTNTNYYVPFYYQVGSYSSVSSQFIIPASDLAAMQWGSIDKLTFYHYNATVSFGEANFTVYAGETTSTTQSTLTDWAMLNSCYTGTVSVSNNKMEIVFSTPYTYTGENLLIGFKLNSTGTNGSGQWYGDNTKPSGTSVYTSWSSSASPAAFAPKVTIEYTPGTAPSCMKPSGLEVTSVGHDATLTWQSEASQWQVARATSATADPSENIIATVSAKTFTDETLPLGDYYYWVRSYCSDSEQSDWSGPVSVHIGYCEPINTNHDGKGITGVAFGMGDDIVNNTNTTSGLPTTSPYYGNYTSMIGAVQAGVDATIAITTATGNYPYTFLIWVDFDNSLSFEDSEVVYTGKCTTGAMTLNANITVPATQAIGDYVMRISGADSYYNNFYNNGNLDWTKEHNPCNASSSAYMVTHDYTLRVLEKPSCLTPTALNVTTNSGTATATWSGEGTSYNIDINGTVTNNVTSPYEFAVELSTDYAVKVQTNCSDDETSDWSNAFNFTTPACWNGHIIEYTLTDSYGDGWNGNAINVIEGCNLLTTLTIESGATKSGTLELCGDYYEFVWEKGDYPTETSWVFTEGGTTLFSGAGTNSMATGDVLYTIGTITCAVPSGLTHGTPDVDEVELSWTENGTATSWQICINGDETNLVTANTNPFTLGGLTPDTDYTVKVRAYCDKDDQSCWSDEDTFTTEEACAKPTGLAATNITTESATLSWTGTNDSYVLQYRPWYPAGEDKQPTSDVMTPATYDLSGFTGTGSVVIRHYNSYNQFALIVDDIVVKNSSDEVIFSEDFELCGGNMPTAFTNMDMDGDGHVWEIAAAPDMRVNGSYGLASYSFDNDTGSVLYPDNWLIINNIPMGGSITFNYCAQDPDWAAETFCVYVSTENSIVEIPLTATTYDAPGLEPNTPYAWQVKGVCPKYQSNWVSSFFQTLNDVIFFQTDGNWNDAANWDVNRVPTADDKVQIDADAIIPDGVVAYAKTTTMGTGSITINEGGQLKQGTTTVDVTVEKSITGYGAGDDHWNLIATPVGTTLFASYTSGWGYAQNLLNNVYDLYAFDATQPEEEWYNYKANTSDFTKLYANQGYLYANSADVQLNFIGTTPVKSLNHTVNVDFVYDGESTNPFNGFVLVGNPYTCQAYLTFTPAGAVPENIDFYVMKADGSGFELGQTEVALNVCQGAFFYADATGTINFSSEVPTSKRGNGALNINLMQNGKVADMARIRFSEGMRLAKYQLNESSKIYFTQENKDYAVVHTQAEGEMPLNFKAETTGNYTISFKLDGANVGYLHLIDKATGEDINLLTNPEYNFIGSTRDEEDRFIIRFNETASNDFFVYQSGDQLIVNGEGTLQVYDVMGRFVASYNVSGTESISASQFENAVYIFRLVGTDVKTQKIVVR